MVLSSGKPRTANLWTAPERDRVFMQAVHETRVLTIRQEGKNKRDVGQVGFIQEPLASYLVFPKSLAEFQNARVVGIKYDLLETPGPVGPAVLPESLKRQELKERHGKTLRHHRPSSEETTVHPPDGTIADGARSKRFRMTVRFNAMVDVEHEVEAQSKAEARKKLDQNPPKPGFSRATITRRIIRITLVHRNNKKTKNPPLRIEERG